MAMVSLMLAAPIMAAEKKAENMPIVGIVLGVLEIPVSTIKNAVNCRSVIDCINIPKHLGEGIINGGERILGTTFMPGSYERDFGENSKAASNAIASNLIGWAGTGWCAASLGMASNGIFSINQSHNALMVTGVIAGAGAAVAESIAK
ncbi:hypothetical protein KKD04_00350 [Patescibacteria group bacterium]|nr:hypothetical protein [Patescibacteria group bacterium]